MWVLWERLTHHLGAVRWESLSGKVSASHARRSNARRLRKSRTTVTGIRILLRVLRGHGGEGQMRCRTSWRASRCGGKQGIRVPAWIRCLVCICCVGRWPPRPLALAFKRNVFSGIRETQAPSSDSQETAMGDKSLKIPLGQSLQALSHHIYFSESHRQQGAESDCATP